jgi:hypothetical protein
MQGLTAGKLLLTATSAWSTFGSYVFDWNDTHIHNPEWTPHAKFHNAQSMSMGAYLGAPALYTLWRRGGWDARALNATALAASGYWVTQLSAALYPGTALFDYARKPRNASGNALREDDDTAAPSGTPPRICGPQPVVSAVALAMNALAYGLERRRLSRRQLTGPRQRTRQAPTP